MKWYSTRFLHAAGVISLTALFAALPARLFAAGSHDFPHKPLALSIVFSPGGILDAAARPAGHSPGAAVSNTLMYISHRDQALRKPSADLKPVLAFGQAASLAASRERKGKLRVGVPGLADQPATRPE